MDCDYARQFLPYLRAGAKDLDGDEADSLRAHLERCAACNALSMNAARLDAHLGRAMRAVEVPVGMKARLLERLAEQRGAARRRWLRRAAAVTAVAASLLLAVLGWMWVADQKPIDPNRVAVAASMHTPPSEDDPATSQGGLPPFVDPAHAFLVGQPTLAELPGHSGKKVPQYVFVRSPAQKTANDEPQVAIVYSVPKRRYKVGDLAPSDPSYRYQAGVRRGTEADYVILYNGRDYDWLIAAER